MGMLCVQACAPGLERDISVRQIVSPESSVITEVNDLKISVGEIQDLRQDPSIGMIGDTKLMPREKPAQSVQIALEQKLKARGFSLKHFNAPVLVGDLYDWRVNVSQNFPLAEVQASAKVKLRLAAPNSSSFYEATYEGESSGKSPIFSQGKIEEMLGAAMSVALDEALRDDKLLAKISEAQLR